MSENKQNTPHEIDLLELFQRIGQSLINGVKGLLKAIIFLISFGFKNWLYIGAFGLIGGLLGFGFGSITRPFFSSEMIAQPNGITSMDMVTYINDLVPLCQTKNYEALGNLLELEDSTIEKIKIIKAYHYLDVNGDGIGDVIDYKNHYQAKDTTVHLIQDRFVVGVELYDNYSFKDIQKGIYKYIDKNPYLKRLNEIRKQELETLITNTSYEIGKLDSLQNYEYFKADQLVTSRQMQSQLTFLAERDKPLYYQNKLSLLESLQRYQKELALATDPITIIKDFTELTVEENPRGTQTINGALYFGIITYLVLLTIRLLPKIREKLG